MVTRMMIFLCRSKSPPTNQGEQSNCRIMFARETPSTAPLMDGKESGNVIVTIAQAGARFCQGIVNRLSFKIIGICDERYAFWLGTRRASLPLPY